MENPAHVLIKNIIVNVSKGRMRAFRGKCVACERLHNTLTDTLYKMSREDIQLRTLDFKRNPYKLFAYVIVASGKA